MANQWGRDSQVATRPKERSLFIPVVISLVFGAAIAYGVLDYLGSGKVPAEQLSEAKTKISDLEQTVFKLKGDLETARAQPAGKPETDSQLSALKDENRRLSDELAAANEKLPELTKSLADLDEARNRIDDLRAENSGLKANLKSLTDAANQGNDVSAQRTSQLEAANKQLAADLLAQQDSALKEISGLKTQLQAAQKAADARSALEIKLGQVKDAKAKLELDLNAKLDALNKKLLASQASERDLLTKLDEAQKSTTDVFSLKTKVQSQASDIADLTNKLNIATDSVTALTGDLAAAKTALADISAKYADTRGQLDKATAQLADLTAAKPADLPVKKDTPPAASVAAQRDASAVAKAMSSATGNQTLNAGQKSDLQTRLEKGDCVGDSLKSALGHVPVLMLRDLIRDLKSDC